MNQPDPFPITSRAALIALTAGLCTAFPGIASAGAQPRACTTTARVARSACDFSVQDDYLIAIGKCLNVANRDEQSDCYDEAKQQRREDGGQCREQLGARKDVCGLVGEAPYDPAIEPGNFLDKAGILAQPNRLFPLVPGRTYVYRNGNETVRTAITGDTRQILGVTVIVVHDVSTVGGVVQEDTDDWYAQDVEGNVWYFGESSRQFEDGELVSIDGSWQAGADGAKPGILMPAAPQVGDTYRQEFSLGEAEDMGQVLDTAGSATTVPASCSHTCLVTRDFSGLEPDANENKYYAPDVGLVLTIDMATGQREELVEIVNESP